MVIVILGAPGAGKGTVSKKLSTILGIPHISTGDLIRDKVKAGDVKAHIYQKIMDEGKLISDEDIFAIVEERLSQDDTKNGLIFDGFPRNLHQVELCDKVLAKFGKKVIHAINLDVAQNLLINRTTNRRVCPKCGAIYHLINIPTKVEGICDECGTKIIQRTDDSEEQVKLRLETYYEQTRPLIDYYKTQGKLFNINIPVERGAELTVKEILEYLKENE